MTNQNEKRYMEEDEIDLRKLFKTIWDKKIFILVFTFSIAIFFILYVNLKNSTPIYKGSVMVEIGEVKNNIGNIFYFDNAYTLKELTEKFENVSISIVQRTKNILIVSSSSTNKDEIRKNIQSSVEFILHRHKDKIYLYDKYIMTKQIGDINISNTPTNAPKKKLIITVAFVTGFILSILIVFLMQFINSFKEEEK